MTPPTPEAGPPGHPQPEAPFDPEATVHLLALVRADAGDALNRLLDRCLPPLRRWARGRFPTHLREKLEASDFVQETVVAALARLIKPFAALKGDRGVDRFGRSLRVGFRYAQFLNSFDGADFLAPGSFVADKEGVWTITVGFDLAAK
jgi:hypothetical protein